MKFVASKEEAIASMLLKLRGKFRAFVDAITFDLRWTAISDDGEYIFLDGHEERIKEIEELGKDILFYMESVKKLREEIYKKDGKPDERCKHDKGQEDCGGEHRVGNEEDIGAATE